MQQITSSATTTTNPLPPPPPPEPQPQPKPKPTKQGLIFSMDLGQNNGPFLLKDINMTNQKSVRLLLKSAELKRVASQASNMLEGNNASKIDLSGMDRVFEDWQGVIERKLGIRKTQIFKLTDPSKEDIEVQSEDGQKKKKETIDLENVEEKYRTKLANIENLTTEITFHTDTVTGLQKDLKELKIISKKLKEEIGNLKVLIQELNTETLKKQMIPYMREFYANNVKVLMKEEDNEVFKMKKEAANLEREKARLIREIDWAEKQIKKNEKFVEKAQKDLKMLLLTGTKTGDSALGLDQAALSLLSLPFMQELEANIPKPGASKSKRRKSRSRSSSSSFERNSQEVRSVSEHSEIKEEEPPERKQEPINAFDKPKFEDENFEDFEAVEPHPKPVPPPKKIIKRVYSYEEISMDKGPEQFLKVLSKDNKQRFFRLSDLYFPKNDTEFQELKLQIDRENERNSFPKLMSVVGLKDRRIQLNEYFKALGKAKIPMENQPQQTEKHQDKSERQQEEVKSIVKILNYADKPHTFSRQIPKCFNKIASQEFFLDLRRSLLSNINENSFNPETEFFDRPCEPFERPLDAMEMSFRDPNEYPKTLKGFETPALDMGFTEPLSEKKSLVEGGKTGKVHHAGLETPGLDMGFMTSSMIKNDSNQDGNDEEAMLMEFKGCLKGPDAKTLWGEVKGTCEGEGMLRPSSVFQVRNEPEQENPGFNAFSRKDLLIKSRNFMNPQLLDLKGLLAKDTVESNSILINLNEVSVFYEPIHSKMRKKTAEHAQPEPQDAARNEEGELEQEGQKEANERNDNDSWSLSSKNTGTRPLNSKFKQLKLKEMRIQAVKEGIDPQSVSLSEEVARRKENTDKQEKKLGFNSGFWQVLENAKKLQKKTKLQHSQIAEKFVFNNFQMSSENSSEFHRFDLLSEVFEKGRHTLLSRPWRIELVSNAKDKARNLKRRAGDSAGLEEINEMVDSFEFFKSRKRLSCRGDKNDSCVLFEYMEENPLILSNLGMGSKMYKYIYPQRVYSKIRKLNDDGNGKNLVAERTNKSPEKMEIEPKQDKKDKMVENNSNNMEIPNQDPSLHNPEKDIQKFKELVAETLGTHGSLYFLKNNEKLPLIGQLLDEKHFGLTVLENNLFNVAVFKQKLPKTDFLLVKSRLEDGSFAYFLRKVEFIFIVGQIEPKLEVFSPSSRMLSSFIRRCLKFEIKQKFKTEGYVDLRELAAIFPSINEHNIRKTIRELGGEQDLGDNKLFHYNKEMIDSENEHILSLDEIDITPEEMCLYERMHACLSNLKEFGLTELINADKINLARNKFIRRNNIENPGVNPATIRKNLIAKLIAEELQLTSWNLSQSFLTAKQTQGRLYLTGFGDPTNGHGGYSYVKKPLKTSRYEKEDKNPQEPKKPTPGANPAPLGPGTSVTGTDADLRKLEMSTVNSYLLKYGSNPELIAKLSRWEKIDLLRQISNQKIKEAAGDQAESLRIQNELGKFARSMRITTKMQKEIYQKEINRLFGILVEVLSKTIVPVEEKENQEMVFEESIESLVRREEKSLLKELRKKEGKGERKNYGGGEDLEKLKKLAKKYGKGE